MALVEHYMVDGQIIAPTTIYIKPFERILPIDLFLDVWYRVVRLRRTLQFE